MVNIEMQNLEKKMLVYRGMSSSLMNLMGNGPISIMQQQRRAWETF